MTEKQLDLGFSTPSPTCAMPSVSDGPSSKTYPDCSATTTAKTLEKWLENYVGPRFLYREADGKMPDLLPALKDSSSGLCWTRNLCEWNRTLAPSLKDEGVCSLSEILEIGGVDRRYFLSPKACAGILRRAAKRGRELPHALREALTAVAKAGTPADDKRTRQTSSLR